MKNSIKKQVINSFLIIILISLLINFVTGLNSTITATSDGSYISPTSDGNYNSPKSDGNYAEPKTDGNYKSVKTDNNYNSPKSDGNYTTPKSDGNYTTPKSDGNYTTPKSDGTYIKNINESENINYKINKSKDQIIIVDINDSQKELKNVTIEIRNVTVILLENKTSKNDQIPKWPFVGKWRPITKFVSYGDGDWKYEPTPNSLLDIKEEHTWEFDSMSGTWEVYPIEENDWERWQIKSYGPKTKMVFENPKASFADGPMEGNAIWVIYEKDLEDGKGKRNIQMKFQKAVAQWNFPLTVKKIGAGYVRSMDNQIDCGNTCLKNFGSQTMVELIATAEDGWNFVGWSGDCNSNERICRVKMENKKTVTAEFKGSCKEDLECPLDQSCINSNCVQVNCACGTINEHICNAYECCLDTDCKENTACSIGVHQCIAKSQCKEVLINGNAAVKHDIVIIGSGFKDYTKLKKGIELLMNFQGDVDGIGVFSVNPFRENKNKFNVWMVLATDYKYNKEPSGFGNLLLNVPVEDDYERFVRTCNRDTVIILSTEMFRPWAQFPTSGASGGVVFMSLNNPLKGSDFFGRTLVHELGHAIGGLADEYIEFNAPDLTKAYDFPNCASTLQDAQKKWSNLVKIRGVDYYTGIPNILGTKYYKNPVASFPELGYFPDGSDWGDGGCGRVHKNIRPTITSIMKDHYTFDNDFGPVNERVLNQKFEGYK